MGFTSFINQKGKSSLQISQLSSSHFVFLPSTMCIVIACLGFSDQFASLKCTNYPSKTITSPILASKQTAFDVSNFVCSAS